MISSIKTPGVYINEINAFPPSIAQVATAIPAFIGYTEKKLDPPTKINSLLEYQEFFGGSPEPESITIDISTDVYDVNQSKFKMYNSLRLFYANGGGECYIVSIGKYSDKPDFSSQDPFIAGIDLLEKFDEPTLLLFPDAINLGAVNLGLVQQQALMQCADLMDRFTIMDVVQKKDNGLDKDSEEFRDAVGNQNLKYGGAYYPYLQTNFGYNYRFKQIESGGVNFKAMYATDVQISTALTDFDLLHKDISDSTTGILKDWEDAVTANTKDTNVDTETKVKNYINKIWNLLEVLGDPNGDLTNAGLKTFVNNTIPISLKSYAQKLVDFKAAYEKLKKAGGANNVAKLAALDNDAKFKGVWGNIKDDYSVSSSNPYENGVISIAVAADAGPPVVAAHNVPDFSKIQAQIDKLHGQITTSMNAVINAINDFELKIENDLVSLLPIYPSLIAELSKKMNAVPPSGAIAGIYANIDATRGVWKAPGNISVNGIIGLTDDINDKEQQNMNIHESGKSINAIRKFTGRGLLVWGARTLNGNSNDWRYINVRRLANMIEESAKKACMTFIFEPNVKQTWVNVKGMIDNYLTTLWSDGALAGAVPEDAFFVSVGLNETMNANDINNGRMIVRIGYAPSKPAEFIILEFTQTQQKS